MKTVYKRYRYRIYPTEEQRIFFSKNFGCARFVYNHFLHEWEETYSKTKKGLSANKCKKMIPILSEEYTWLKEADSTGLQSSVEFLAEAYNNFFKGKHGKPKCHKKKGELSYTAKNNNNVIRIEGDSFIRLPKVENVRFKNSRKIDGRIVNATVILKPSGKYFVSITVETTVDDLPKNGKEVGIDLGLKDFAILSDGSIIANPHFNRKLQDKLKKAQRKLSRMERANIDHYETFERDGNTYRKPIYKRPLSDCRNYQKQCKKVARIYEKIVNQRTDFEQKLSTQLIREYDTICLEDLAVKNMVKNHKLAYAINEVSWSEFTRMLEYKAEWYGKKIVYIDRFFPSSQTCSVCGTVSPITKDLKVREWICPACGAHLNRDVNAAINILHEGLRTVGTTGLA